MVLLVFAGVLIYLAWQSKQSDPTKDAATSPAGQSPTSGPAASAPAPEPTQAEAPKPKPKPEPEPAAGKPKHTWNDNRMRSGREYHILGSLDANSGYVFQIELTSRGAAVYTVKLAKYYETVDDKRLAQDDPAAYAKALRDRPDKYKGHYPVLNPVRSGGREYLSFATQTLTIRDAAGKELWWGDLSSLDWRLDKSQPTTNPAVAQKLQFSYTLYRDVPKRALKDPKKYARYAFLTIYKTYTVRKDDYTLGVEVSFKNHTKGPLTVAFDQSGPTGVPRENYRQDMRHAGYGCLNLEDNLAEIRLKPRGELAKWKPGAPERVGDSVGDNNQGPILWVGQTNQFFGSMMYLVPREPESLAAPNYQAGFYVAAVEESPTSRTFLTGVEIPALKLPKGLSGPVVFDVFAGPKKRDMFDDEKAPYFKQQYKDLNYLGTIQFVGCTFCTIPGLSRGMMWLLQKLSAVGNYGVAIIILVVMVRLVLHPLTKRSQVSMAKMQKLSPKMQKLKEKYADDKDTLNKEMMKLYKQQGATPLLGCLPMFLQMPIWIALWTALRASVELRHAAFLPFWLTDLAAPDRLFTWDASLPLIGNSLNLLPVLLTVAMFFQTMLNPQMSGQAPSASKEQAQQQKMMKFMMPVMMLLIFYNMPSGLNLYIMTSTFAGVTESFFIRKHIRVKQEAEEAVETKVAVPGKGPRASRPKKPKGPFWTKRG